MKDTKIFDIGNIENIIKDFLHSTLKEIMSVVNADSGSLFLFDTERKELVLDSFYNSTNLHIEGLKQRIGEGVSGKVFELKSPVLVSDIDKDLRFKRNGFNHYRTNSFMSIPLIRHQGIIGLINLSDKANDEPFSESDLRFAVTLSKYTCIIVENILHSLILKNEKEALNKQNLLLEKYASVGKLAANVVHEINNPLDGVIRYINILMDQVENNSVTEEYLTKVKNGLRRIANITKSLLEFSRQVNNSSNQIKRYIDVHELIDRSLDVLCEKIDTHIRVNKRYADSLPRVLDLGLQHVLTNIIKNALDAMHTGGTLEISTDIRDSKVRLVFKDTGIGIPIEIMDHIFEPFFTTKTIDKGTGLGLSICREIINRYEGKIEVQSFPGEGSRFSIVIPIKYCENA